MGKIADLRKKIKNVSVKDQEKALLEIIRENEDWIVDLNRVQLLEGKDSNDSMLQEYKSKSYAAYKQKLNPLGVTDLKLTGKFHDSFILRAKQFPISIDAKDKKRNELVNKYGKDIFGLTEESKELLVERLKERVRQYYRKLINI